MTHELKTRLTSIRDELNSIIGFPFTMDEENFLNLTIGDIKQGIKADENRIERLQKLAEILTETLEWE